MLLSLKTFMSSTSLVPSEPTLPQLQLLCLFPARLQDENDELPTHKVHVSQLAQVLPIIPATCSILLLASQHLTVMYAHRDELPSALEQLTSWLECGGKLCARLPAELSQPLLAAASSYRPPSSHQAGGGDQLRCQGAPTLSQC